jgi:hypothetical protein
MDGYEELWALEDQLMSRPAALGRFLGGDREAWRRQRALRRELRNQSATRLGKAEQIFNEIRRQFGRDAERQARFEAPIAWDVYTNGGSEKRPIPWDMFAEEARGKVIEGQQGGTQ